MKASSTGLSAGRAGRAGGVSTTGVVVRLISRVVAKARTPMRPMTRRARRIVLGVIQSCTRPLARDIVGDSRIEEIRDDRVLLRRGDDVIHLFIGGASSTEDPADRASASSAPPPATPKVELGPVVGNGEAWLEHLGIPPQALSRAIEAVPTKGP